MTEKYKHYTHVEERFAGLLKSVSDMGWNCEKARQLCELARCRLSSADYFLKRSEIDPIGVDAAVWLGTDRNDPARIGLAYADRSLFARVGVDGTRRELADLTPREAIRAATLVQALVDVLRAGIKDTLAAAAELPDTYGESK